MKRLLLTMVISLLIAIYVHAQSGPHDPNSKILYVVFSYDHTRFLTISYLDIALWNQQTYELIWHKKLSEILRGHVDLRYAKDPTLKFIKLITQTDDIVLNLQTLEFKPSNVYVEAIAANGRVGKSMDAFGNPCLVDLFTGQKEVELKGFIYGSLSDDGKKIIAYNSKKHKIREYDIETKKVTDRDGEKQWLQYRVNFIPDEGKVLVYDRDQKTIGSFKVAATKVEFPQELDMQEDRSQVFILEDRGKMGQNSWISQNHLVCYKILTGELIKDLELHGPADGANKDQELARQKADAEAKRKEEERKAMLANAKAGFREFDGKFTSLALPYTMDYNKAQGFDLSGDAFAYNELKPRSGSGIFGMGKICSCNDRSSYLVMMRNTSGSTDVTNFIVLSYQIDGKLVGMRNIGATQKDPSGIIRFDFSISGGGCSAEITGKMTHPNGYTENKSVSIANCTVPY